MGDRPRNFRWADWVGIRGVGLYEVHSNIEVTNAREIGVLPNFSCNDAGWLEYQCPGESQPDALMKTADRNFGTPLKGIRF